VANTVANVNVKLDAQIEKEDRIMIRRWLHPDWVDSEVGLTSALRQKSADTGKWLFDSGEYEDWILSRNSRIWLYGIGKILSL
jgi:hypothetical protein